MDKTEKIKIDFIAQWGIIGTSWGVNKTMGQIFALLTLSEKLLNTDEIMEKLCISRGNAHSNLKELVQWGIVKKSIPLGSRKDLFEAESDQWKVACLVAKARREREIVPAIDLLEQTIMALKAEKVSSSQKFTIKRLTMILEFIALTNKVLKVVSRSEESLVVNWIKKLIKKH